MAVNKALCFFLVSRVLLTWEPVRTNCATISCRNGWDLWYNPLLWKCRPHLQLTAFTSVSATANPTWHAVHWPVLVAVFRLERTHLVRHRYECLYTDYIQQITNWRPVGQIRANNPVHNWIQRLWTDNEKKKIKPLWLYLKINLIIILQFYILVFFSTRKAVADFLTYYCSSPKPLNADNVGYTVTFIIAFVTQATKMCKLIAAVCFFSKPTSCCVSQIIQAVPLSWLRLWFHADR